MDRQSWWVECKGRSGTVEPEAVKTAVNNAMARADLDVLVIATKTTFSNPTRDWVLWSAPGLSAGCFNGASTTTFDRQHPERRSPPSH